MHRRAYFLVTGAFFAVLSIGHLARLLFSWDVAVAGRSVPHRVSFPALIVAGSLAAFGFLLAGKERG